MAAAAPRASSRSSGSASGSSGSKGTTPAPPAPKRSSGRGGTLTLLRRLLRRLTWLHWTGVVGLGMAMLAARHFLQSVDDAEARIQGADDLYQRGNALFKAGQKAKAIELYRKAVKLFPNHVYAWSNLGTVLRELGHLDDAVHAHERALALLPKPRNYYNLAVAYQSQGDNVRAIEHYRQCLALDEASHPDSHFNLGVALQETGDLAGASREYLRAYELDPSHPGSWGNHCNVLQAQQKEAEAELCYKEVIKAHPEYDRAYVNLGGLYYIQGDMEKAAASYVKALDVNPDNAIARHALGALQGEKLDGASLDYLAQLFDSYSATFDASLHALEYKSPELLRRAVDAFLATPAGKPLRPSRKKGKGWRVMDAGCGTGLSGVLFRNMSEHLVGVDISRRMVQRAAQRKIYDELSTGDMAEELAAHSSSGGAFDLLVSADVLVYFGRLEYILATMTKALRPKTGLMAFTLEALKDGDPQLERERERQQSQAADQHQEGWILRDTGRYAHRRDYVEGVAAKAGLEVLSVQEMVGRRDKGKDIPGFLFLMRRLR